MSSLSSSSSSSSVNSISSVSSHWYDIGLHLLSLCSSLPVGYYLYDTSSSFSLYQAMSALELMDPRMDNGAADTHDIDSDTTTAATNTTTNTTSSRSGTANGDDESTSSHSIDRSSSSQQRPQLQHHHHHHRHHHRYHRYHTCLNPSNQLSSDVWNDKIILMIVDQLLCCQMSYLSGISLPHSLYTFIPLHKNPYQYITAHNNNRNNNNTPDHINEDHNSNMSSTISRRILPHLHHPYLRVISLLILHCCHLWRNVIHRADLYEEGEWNMATFGLDIEDRGGGDELIHTSNNLQEEIQTQIKEIEMEMEMERETDNGLDNNNSRHHNNTSHNTSHHHHHTNNNNNNNTSGDHDHVHNNNNNNNNNTNNNSVVRSLLDVRLSLLVRLRYHHNMYLLFLHLTRLPYPTHYHTSIKLRNRCQLYLDQIMRETRMTSDSSYLGEFVSFLSSIDSPFDPHITSSLIFHAPPRIYPICSLLQGYNIARSLLTQLIWIFSTPSLPSLSAAISFCADLCAIPTAISIHQPMNILLRSLLFLSLQQADNVANSQQSLHRWIEQYIIDISPSTAVFLSPLLKKYLFMPSMPNMNNDDPSSSNTNNIDMPPLPYPDLFPSLFDHLSQFFHSYFRLLLTDRNKQRKQQQQIFQLLSSLQQAADNCDKWMIHASQHIGIELSSSSFDSFDMMNDISTSISMDSPYYKAEKQKVYDGGFFSAILELSCQSAIIYIARQLESGLFTSREMNIIYWLLHYYSDIRYRNKLRAYRDPKLAPIIINTIVTQYQSSSSSSSQHHHHHHHINSAIQKKNKKRLKQLDSLLTFPPSHCHSLSDIEWLRWSCLDLMSQGIIAALQGYAAMNDIVISTIPDHLFTVYFSHRFHDFSYLQHPAISYQLYRTDMETQFKHRSIIQRFNSAQTAFQQLKDKATQINTYIKHQQLNTTATTTTTTTIITGNISSSISDESTSTSIPLFDLSRISFFTADVEVGLIRSILKSTITNILTNNKYINKYTTDSNSNISNSNSNTINSSQTKQRLIFAFDLNPIYPTITTKGL